MDNSHLQYNSRKTVQKRNTANDTVNSQTKQHDLSSSLLDSTLNTSDNKFREVTNTNPFKKPRVKKVKTSFALDTTQEENVSFEEEQQKYKPVESETNPFRKNLKQKKFSVRFEKTFDSSNESVQETEKTPLKEDGISTNNDSISNVNKEGVTQNPFKRSNKRKRYSIAGKLDTSIASPYKQSETVDVQHSETIFTPHNLQVTKDNAKHNPFTKVNLRRFSFNVTLDASGASNVNESNSSEKRIEENTEIQQLYQPNLLTSEAIQEDLLMKNNENAEVEIKTGIEKCLGFYESLVSQTGSIIKIKDHLKSPDISYNVENIAITTIAETHSGEEPLAQISTKSMQMPSIETSKISSEGILQFVKSGTAAPKNVDKSDLLPNNETKSCNSLSSNINLKNRAETKDANARDEVEDSKEDDAQVASNENVLTSPNELCAHVEVVLSNILSSPVSNTTLNSIQAVTQERNNSLPINSDINKTRNQIPQKSNISEEETQCKQPHKTLSDDVENLSELIVTTTAEIHLTKESESESCMEPTQDQNINEVKRNNEKLSQTASQSGNKHELLNKKTDTCDSLDSHVNSKNKAETDDANERVEKEILKEAEAQMGSNGSVPISPGVGMAAKPLIESVEAEALLLKNTCSEDSLLPVISETFISQLKPRMDDSHLQYNTRKTVQKRNTANDTVNSQTKQHDLSSSLLDSTLNTSDNKFRDITNTNPFKKARVKKVKASFALDTTQEENVSFEEEQQKYKQVESETNPFRKNLKRKKFSVRFEKTFDSSNESIQETDTTPLKEDGISKNNDSICNVNKEGVTQNPFKRTNELKRYSLAGKLDTSIASTDKQSETVDVQRSETSDASSINETYIYGKGIEKNAEIQQLNKSNLSTSGKIQEELLMQNYANVDPEINASAQKCSEFNESPLSQNDSIKIKEQAAENLAMCTATTIAEIHSREESLTGIFTESTQILSIEAAECSENISEGIAQFVEIGTAAPDNVDESALLPNNETKSCPSLDSESQAVTEDANARDEVEDSRENGAQAASNENVLTPPDERCTGDEVVISNILSSPISNTALNSLRSVSKERNSSLPTNSERNNAVQISLESSEGQVEKVLLEKERKIESANYKKPSNISEEKSAPQSKHPCGTITDDVENISVCVVTTIAEIHSYKESESDGCTEPTQNHKVECGTNEVRENNGEEMLQIMEVGTPASQNVGKNKLTEGTDSRDSLGSHVNFENKAEPDNANERVQKEIHKEAEAQMELNGSVPRKLYLVPGNILLSSSPNGIVASASQLSEKKEISKNFEKKAENLQITRLTENKSKTGIYTMSMLSLTKNSIRAQTGDNEIHLLPTPLPSNDELSVEQSPIFCQTGNGHFVEDECVLNKDDSKRLVQRKSPRIAGLCCNKSYEVINTSKNSSTKLRKASENLREINYISPALMESKSKGDVDKIINVSNNIASSEASATNLNCKPDKKIDETNISNGVEKVASRNKVSKISRQNECLKDVTSEVTNDEYNSNTEGTDNQAVDKQQLSDSGKRKREKCSRNISVVTSILKSNSERNEGVANSKWQTPLKDTNKITTESPKCSSKEKEKPPDSFTTKGNTERFGELSVSFDVSAILNDKLISSKKKKYKSTPFVQRSSRSKRLSVNVLLQNENRKSSLGDNLSTFSSRKHSEEMEKVLREKTHNTANDFEFAAPKYVTRKSSITTVKKPRRSVTFRPHSSLIPYQDDSINIKKSGGGISGRKFSVDVQTSEGEKSKNSMVHNSCKIVPSTNISTKDVSKKLNNYSAVDNKTKIFPMRLHQK